MTNKLELNLIGRVLIFMAFVVAAIALGSYMASHIERIFGAITMSVLGTVLLLSNFVTKALNEGFTAQLKSARELPTKQYAAFVAYISAKRFETNIAYVFANVAGGVAAFAASTYFVPNLKRVVAGPAQNWIFAIGFALTLLALPMLVRSVNYWRLLDRFIHEIDMIVDEQKLRARRLADLPNIAGQDRQLAERAS